MTVFEQIIIVLLAILTISQFVTMISNVTGNIAHRQQVNDVRKMRNTQEHDYEEERTFREDVIRDLKHAQEELDATRRDWLAWQAENSAGKRFG